MRPHSHRDATQRIIDDISAQSRYSTQMQKCRKLGLTVPDAFVRGIRHLGYRSSVEAIAELVDNAIQAYAEHIDIVFGYDGKDSQKKPSQIAVLDDGHGMAPDMIRLAMMWGGTHRENDRSGLGRYGYGLPCSTLSIGKRFAVISKLTGGSPKQVTLDIDDLNDGKYTDSEGDTIIPSPCDAHIPKFVSEFIELVYPDGWESGTVVLIEKLDRLDWSTTTGFSKQLDRRFSVTYHKLLASTLISIDGNPISPADPLFLDPSHALFQIDDDRAVALEPVSLEVATSTGTAKILLRYSYLPPSFASIEKSRDAVGLNANERFPVLKDYHGIIFSRNGRLIDCKAKTPWTTFINNDRYIRIEVEFPASLDELFGVTTAKQQISVSSEIWDRLREAGLAKAIEQLRTRVRSLKIERARDPASAVPVGPAGKLRGSISRWQPASIPNTSGQGGEGGGVSRPLLLRASGGSFKPNMEHPAFARDGRPDPIALQAALEALLDAIVCCDREQTKVRRRICADILMDWGRSLGTGVSSIADILPPEPA
jgi:hypothetical protein